MKKQLLFNSIGNLIYVASLWILTVITTQRLGYEFAGWLTLAMTIGNVSVAIQLFGVRAYQSSDMSFEYSANEYLISRLFTLVIGFAFSLIICLVKGYAFSVLICIVLFMILKSCEAFSDVLYGNFQRAGKLHIAGYFMFLHGVLIIVLFTISIWKTNSLNFSLLIISIASFLLSFVAELIVHNKIVINPNYSLKNVYNIIKECFTLFIASVIPIVIIAFPRLVLESYYGSELLGFYGNVSTPSLLITTVVPVILTAFLPSFGIAFKERDKSKILKFWLFTLIGCFCFGLFFSLLMFLSAKRLLSFIYTDQILPYVKYLYPIILAITIYAFTMCNYTVLIAIRRKKIIILAALLALFVCLFTSVCFIKNNAIEGVIMVMIITYFIQFLVQTVFLLKSVKSLE